MKKILVEAKRCIDRYRSYNNIKEINRQSGYLSCNEALAASAVGLSFQINANVIIIITKKGTLTGLVAKYNPQAMIICIS